jgi:hypothetical protein
MASRGWIASSLWLLCAALAGPLAAAEITLRDDGWYRWEVAAGAGGRDACCYEFRGGKITGAVGCRLGHGEDDLAAAENCEVGSDSMQVFVEVQNGRVQDIRALSSACPVSIAGDVRTMDDVSTADSIAWLIAQVDGSPRVAEDAIMALSFHTERQALDALIGLVEDTGQRHDAREQALFWLVQTESDEAFAYLDRLLD